MGTTYKYVEFRRQFYWEKCRLNKRQSILIQLTSTTNRFRVKCLTEDRPTEEKKKFNFNVFRRSTWFNDQRNECQNRNGILTQEKTKSRKEKIPINTRCYKIRFSSFSCVRFRILRFDVRS